MKWNYSLVLALPYPPLLTSLNHERTMTSSKELQSVNHRIFWLVNSRRFGRSSGCQVCSLSVQSSWILNTVYLKLATCTCSRLDFFFFFLLFFQKFLSNKNQLRFPIPVHSFSTQGKTPQPDICHSASKQKLLSRCIFYQCMVHIE